MSASLLKIQKPRHVFLRLGAGTDELVRVILVTGTVLDRSFSQ